MDLKLSNLQKIIAKTNQNSSGQLPQLSRLHLHFIGIGGIGVSGLAELFYNMGASVSGSDLKQSEQSLGLKNLGIKICIGHKAENIKKANVVIYSSAILKNNIEYLEAKRLGLSLISRGEALAELMFLKRGVAVAGAHGKTTTTAMLTSVFMPFSPTAVVGGKVNLIKSNSYLGSGQWCLVESDESDGSFVKLRPEIAIITNLDKEHLDYYKSFFNLKKHFLQFGSNIPFYGALIVCGDDKNLLETFKNFYKNIIYYGFDKNNDYFLQSTKLKNKKINIIEKKTNTILASFVAPLPGKHNALNALAAIIAGKQAGLSWKEACKNLSAFTGLSRRFELKSKKKSVLFYDDYAHHPTEITAVISSFKEKYPNKKLKILFQPHRYSRTQESWIDFLKCFKGADQVFVIDIYEAGEQALKGVDSKELAKKIKYVDAKYLKKEDILSHCSNNLFANDIFLSLGAGDIFLWNKKISTAFKNYKTKTYKTHSKNATAKKH